ncbi:hypothetical protein ACFYNO_17380 [Kitasatospora sp. NPDC006697]|uniref:hypothetical protein n=1 Tax=Kitasatospora sp. NPDC006697 TaxID=3364020 RepID=UPI0036B6824A
MPDVTHDTPTGIQRRHPPPAPAAAILGAGDGRRPADRFGGRTLQRVFAVAPLTVAALMGVHALLP